VNSRGSRCFRRAPVLVAVSIMASTLILIGSGPSSAYPPASEARVMLEGLTVAPEGSLSGYNRSAVRWQLAPLLRS
jgi:hypothetical protein